MSRLQLAVRTCVTALTFLSVACGGGDGTAPCTVSAIAISPSAASVVAGATTQLSATISSTNCTPTPTATWSTGDAGVATVNSTGLVTGIAPGVTTISATNGSRQTGATITVTPVPVASVAVTAPSTTVIAGGTLQATATLRDAGNLVLTRPVTWSTSAATVATVNSSGLITALSAGTATITASAEGRSGTLAITVTPAVASVIAEVNETVIFPGGTTTTRVTVLDANNAPLTGRVTAWSSSNAAVATVNPTTGVVLGVSAGTTQIRATVDGVVGQVTLTVGTVTESARFAFMALLTENPLLNSEDRAPAVWQHNATGGVTNVTRTGTGRYRVRFVGLGVPGSNFRETVFVTPMHATAPRHCAVESWTRTNVTDIIVDLSCVDMAGAPANSMFTVALIGSGALGGNHASFWTPTVEPAELVSTYSFNSGTGTNSYTKSSTGLYTAAFGSGPLPTTSHVLVSTYAGSANRHCFTSSWNFVTPSANVRCVLSTDHSQLTDALFTVLMMDRGRNGKRWGYAWSTTTAPTIGVETTPDVTYQGTSNGQQVRMTRTGEGTYTVRFPGLGRPVLSSPETVLLSSYGSDSPGPCNIEQWTTTSPIEVKVRCYSRATGQLANSRFSILVIE